MKPLFFLKRALATVGLGFALLIAGCATYQPPELPDHQVATIALDPNTYKLKFFSVDGAPMSSIGGLNPFAGGKALKLRPGKRVIGIAWSDLNQNQGGTRMAFEAQAGQRYTVYERSEGKKIFTWIANSSGERVPLLPLE